MTEEAKAARREYKRQWAKNNPDLIRAQQERYWDKKARQLQAGEVETRAQIPFDGTESRWEKEQNAD